MVRAIEFIRLVMLVTLLNLVWLPLVLAQSRLDMVKERGMLLAGIKLDPPCGFKDEKGNIVGFDVDILRYIADRLQVTLKLVPVNSSTRITAVADGAVDIGAATLTHTKSRDRVIDYSITYFYDGQKILVRKGSGIKSVKDLVGKRVAAVKGTTAERNIALAQPKAKIIYFNDYKEAVGAFQNGVISAITTDSTMLLGLKATLIHPEKYEVVGDFFSEEPYGLPLPQNDSKWRDAVNEILIEMWNSGAWARAYEKWFGPGTKYEHPIDKMNWKMSTWPLR